MLLDNAMIYRRTDSGVREVYEKSHQFTQSERLILILLDGRLDVAGVKSRLPSVSDERLARALRKLLASGLIEAVADDANLNGGSHGTLQPDAIAQFLEQTDLDPVTVIASTETDAAVGLTLQAAHAEPAPGEVLVRPTTPVSRHVPSTTARSGVRPETASGRSQSAGFEETAWDPVRATDFAITTVNVPDRLDVQEVRARADAEERTPRRLLPDAYTFNLWLRRGLLVAVLAAVGYWGYLALPGLVAEFSPSRMEERLAAATGGPVAVASTHWRLTPSPRFVLEGIVLPGGTAVKEAYLTPAWHKPSEAVGEGRLVWAQVVIPELALSSEQAFAAMRVLPGIGEQLPRAVSALRVESLRVTGSALLPGRYEVVARRDSGGRFRAMEIRDPEAKGNMVLTLLPSSNGESGNDGADFRLEASRWRPPIGPAVEWTDLVAEGRAEPNLLLIRSFLANGFYGAIQGAAAAAADLEWVTTASIRGSNLDLEAMQQSLRSTGTPEAGSGIQAVMQGTASMELIGSGRGATMYEAVAASEVQGPVQVRWGVLNGINLGYAATHGKSAGGITRFSELEARVVASQSGVTLRDIAGRAGAMATSGQFSVAPDLALNGSLRVELGTTRIHAPLNLRVSGTATAPQFGG